MCKNRVDLFALKRPFYQKIDELRLFDITKRISSKKIFAKLSFLPELSFLFCFLKCDDVTFRYTQKKSKTLRNFS